jgi:flagellar biosynthetic protein FliR
MPMLPTWLEESGPLAAAVLVCARLGGLFLSAPLFSERMLLGRARLAFLLALTPPLTSGWLQRPEPEVAAVLDQLGKAGLFELGALALGELLLGLCLGLCARVILAGATAAGALAAYQAGLTMVSSFDASAEVQPLLDVFVSMLLLMFLLGLDLHHAMLRTLGESLLKLPPGGWHHGGIEALRAGQTIFTTGLKLAAPLLVILVLVEVAMGVVQKAGPELQLLVVLMPARLGLGLLILGISLTYWKAELGRLGVEAVVCMQRLVSEMMRL